MRLLMLGAILLAGCAAEQAERPAELTRRERDSVIAASRLPGAAVVGRAIRTADTLNARAAALDSVGR